MEIKAKDFDERIHVEHGMRVVFDNYDYSYHCDIKKTTLNNGSIRIVINSSNKLELPKYFHNESEVGQWIDWMSKA